MSEDLKADIKKARPNVKDSTIKMYESNLKKLKKMFDSDNYDFLKDVDKVKDKLGHYKSLDHNDPQRKKNYYSRHGKATDKNTAKYWSHKILW